MLNPGQISTIVRYHLDHQGLELLRDALTSLAAQKYSECQTVIVLQNGSQQTVDDIAGILASLYPGAHAPDNKQNPVRVGPHKIVPVSVPHGEDARAALLNHGLDQADGRYVAFLDFDDIVYPEAYELLIGTLENTNDAIAVGGANFALMRKNGNEVETYKTFPFLTQEKGIPDLCHKNFIPIHTYVMDRARVNPALLRFDESFSRAEDYVFLLGLAGEHSFNFENLMVPVAEYRMRDDCSNTHPHPWLEYENSSKADEWKRQIGRIHEMKSAMYVKVNVLEMSDLLREVSFLRNLQRNFKLVDYFLKALKLGYRGYQTLSRTVARIFH